MFSTQNDGLKPYLPACCSIRELLAGVCVCALVKRGLNQE